VGDDQSHRQRHRPHLELIAASLDVDLRIDVGIDPRSAGSYPGAVNRAAIVWFLALATGIGFGYLAWGEQDRRAEADLLRDLSALTRRLEEHERVLAELVVEREAKATAALAECEQTSEHVAKQLESCLFEKAGAGRGAQGEPAAPRAMRGTAPFEESVGYPVPIPPKPPED